VAPVRAFVTGGTGFIGGHVVRRLRERGDDVVALVRSPDKASDLRDLGVELVEGDLTDSDAIRRAAKGADAAFHGAAIYKVGIPKKDRDGMYDTNVRGTERVLDAVFEAGVPKIVYLSTVAVFGNTNQQVVDESYERGTGDFLSTYDETKTLAHAAAKDRIAKGYPIVIVQPGGVYGPNDHSELGNMIDQTVSGKLFALPFPDLGLNFVHVEDVADGILLAHDKGEVGESYVLGGQNGTMREFVNKVAEVAGCKAPKRDMPTPLIKTGIPFGPIVGKVLGFPPNLGELVKSSDGVTWWASHEKAHDRLGYSPRGLDAGLRATLAAN
jgi:dihydroflavonol-4-reductase